MAINRIITTAVEADEMDTRCKHVSVIQAPIAFSFSHTSISTTAESSGITSTVDNQSNLLKESFTKETVADPLGNGSSGHSFSYVHWKKGMLPKVDDLPAQPTPPNSTESPDSKPAGKQMAPPSSAQVPHHNRATNWSSNAGKHFSISPYQQPLYCELCDRSFPSGQYFRIHLRYFHSADKQFICRICNDKTKLLSSFKLHLLSIHKKTWKQYLSMVEFVLVGDASKISSNSVPTHSKTKNTAEWRPKGAMLVPQSKANDVSRSTRCLICKQQLKYSSLANHIKRMHGMRMGKYNQLAEC